MDSSIFYLAAQGVDNITMWVIVGGSAIAVVVLFVILRSMASHPPVEHPVRVEEPSELAPPPVVPVSGTKGFVLPAPDPNAPAPSVAPVPPKPQAPPPPKPDISTELTTRLPEFSAPPKPVSKLTFRSGSRAGESVVLDTLGPAIAIGRSEVPENQIVIRDDLKVTRLQHAIISPVPEGGYAIRDNGSANKVFVNDECIEDRQVAIKQGDRIRIGLTELTFDTDSAG